MASVTVASAKGAAQALGSVYAHLSPAVSKLNDFVAKKGAGSWVWTTDDRRLLDFTSGIGVTSTGHCHPAVVRAVQEQAATIVHAQQNVFGAHEKMVELLDSLTNVTPSHLSRFFFCNSGSEAVDNAVKIARSYTGRPNVIAFEGSFHGRTIGAMSLTSSKTIYRQGFQPLMPGAFLAPYPYCLHCKAAEVAGHNQAFSYTLAPAAPPFGDYSSRTCCNGPLEALEWMFKMQTAPQETAAVLIEPILGEGGFITPPPGFLEALRRLCDKAGALLIFDEVQGGVGRTGRWWAHEHFSTPPVKPDMLIFAKGIASGYPLAGLATSEPLFDRLAPGTLGGTYGGNAVACAAAVATLRAIQEEGMLDNATARGAQLAAGLVELAGSYPIQDVRGRGLMLAAEFGGKDGSKTAEKGIATAVAAAAARHGLLVMTAGARETVRLLPALNVTEEEVDMALGMLSEALKDVFGKAGSAEA